MRAFVTGGFRGASQDVLDWYERVIRTLELGCHEWPNVSKDQRGAIFQGTFLRGVRVLYLNAYMQVWSYVDSLLPRID